MISTELARELQDAGLRWAPVSGDAFCIERLSNSSDALEANEVFVVSDMTIEAHAYATGTILGMNGTTEWALDSVALEESLWLPREDQLRDLLAGTFRALRRESGAPALFTVEIHRPDGSRHYTDTDPAQAYGKALLALITGETTERGTEAS
ncbi:pilus assembly protein CpaE [Arthrobacter sp. H14-L1]|uniref:pilus assembly protein CpaE n=1 Tax=Arthrobacter sp. H14-L1 TaxID=2996697 RepID=UPI00226D57A4|nr:pilus assembly protein CpaE [Arthrobacter sp. H14-L1]MCY0906119.1 pilus assembly protein CpaE [Arthrobacter sp. H14-L1]